MAHSRHMSNLSQLLTTREVSQRLDINPRQVARLVVRGELSPAAKAPGVRGAFLFAPADVEQLAQARCVA